LKKTTAILLLAIMVFNLAGYRILFACLENEAQAQMAEKLNSHNYNKAGLAEIKVALHLPYMSNSGGFERCDGVIVLNGITYNYVERKLENDTLVLRCIPNSNIDKVKLAGTEYGKSVNDIQLPQKGSKSGNSLLLLKSLQGGVCGPNNNLSGSNTGFITQRAAYKNFNEKITGKNFAKSPEQPPDVI
jgi:hypothetical protein